MALELVDEMCERGLAFSMEALHSILYASSESCDFNLVSCIILHIYIYLYFVHVYCMTFAISKRKSIISALIYQCNKL